MKIGDYIYACLNSNLVAPFKDAEIRSTTETNQLIVFALADVKKSTKEFDERMKKEITLGCNAYLQLYRVL